MAESCLDLAAEFGGRFRIVYEEQASDWPVSERPWLARIRCRAGHVGVAGGAYAYAFTDRPRIGAQLRALPFVERAQGDTEVRVIFHAEHLAAVLAILRPYRRRHLSEAERRRLAAVGRAALAKHRAAANVESDFPPPGSTQRGGDGRGHGSNGAAA